MNMSMTKRFPIKLDIKHGNVDMSHGSGGRAMAQLIEEIFIKHFDNELLRKGDDQALFKVESSSMAISTDTYVVSPLFFPGGNIGSLAVHGTINDVAMSGAKPLHIAVGFIIEEGFPLSKLDAIVESMAKAAKQADVSIVTGDTKVVEKNKGDGVFITTTGVGVVPDNINISGNLAQTGDAIIINGTVGDHGVAIMSSRENLEFDTCIESDSAALHSLVASMIGVSSNIHCLRDPTRGGVATTLNELAHQSNVGIKLKESSIPINQDVRSACELLGLDPLYVANEGKLICICKFSDAENILQIMRQHPLGKKSMIIGEVVDCSSNFVEMETTLGGRRIVDWLIGEQLPRIC